MKEGHWVAKSDSLIRLGTLIASLPSSPLLVHNLRYFCFLYPQRAEMSCISICNGKSVLSIFKHLCYIHLYLSSSPYMRYRVIERHFSSSSFTAIVKVSSALISLPEQSIFLLFSSFIFSLPWLSSSSLPSYSINTFPLFPSFLFFSSCSLSFYYYYFIFSCSLSPLFLPTPLTLFPTFSSVSLIFPLSSLFSYYYYSSYCLSLP